MYILNFNFLLARTRTGKDLGNDISLWYSYATNGRKLLRPGSLFTHGSPITVYFLTRAI